MESSSKRLPSASGHSLSTMESPGYSSHHKCWHKCGVIGDSISNIASIASAAIALSFLLALSSRYFVGIALDNSIIAAIAVLKLCLLK